MKTLKDRRRDIRTENRRMRERESCGGGGGPSEERERESWKQRSGRTGGWASEPEGKGEEGGGGGGACLEAQPVRGRRAALWGESYPGNTIETVDR